MCCEIMSCSDSSGGVTCDVSLEEPSPSANAGLGGVRREELGHRPGGGACVGGPGVAAARNIEGPLGYALPSSTLTTWGLMAPVRAGLAWPAEGRGSGSLLVMAPGGVLPSTTALRTSRMLFACGAQERTETQGLRPAAQDTEKGSDGVDKQRLQCLLDGPHTAHTSRLTTE